jgi:hypothetical protein
MCNLSISLADWMLSVTTLFTGGLLVIAWLAYNKLLVQEARKKQLEMVVQLVEKLKNLNLNWSGIVVENGEPRIGEWSMLTVFTMKKTNLPQNNSRLFVPHTSESFIWTQEFSNPLMPMSIVKAWGKIVDQSAHYPFYGSNGIPDNFYCVLENPLEVSNKELELYFELDYGTDGFYDRVVALRKSITDWFEKHGIRETNTRVF